MLETEGIIAIEKSEETRATMLDNLLRRALKVCENAGYNGLANDIQEAITAKVRDKVKVISCPTRPDYVGRTGTVITKFNGFTIDGEVVVRVRLDGLSEEGVIEIDGTPEKFQVI